MDKFLASAPGRVFLSGEAAFEFGAKALALPVEVGGKRNKITFTFQESPGKVFVYSDKKVAALLLNGRATGDNELRPYLEYAKTALDSAKIMLETMDTSFSMLVEPNFPQSAGLSTSLCAAVFSAVFNYYAEKRDVSTALIEAVSASGNDNIADVDALIMTSGSGLVVERSFFLDGSVKVAAKKTQLTLPKSTTLLYAEPANSRDKREEVFQKISAFSKVTRAGGKAKEVKQMTSNERAKVGDPFSEMTIRLAKELACDSPSPDKIAVYMDCEQELLSEAGVASSSCLEAVAAAKKAGALAAKSSGFSGGVLAFCQEKDAAAIADSLAVSSLLVYSPLSVSKKGMECTKA